MLIKLLWTTMASWLLLVGPVSLPAQQDAEATAQPVTTSDAGIPVDQLKWMVKPLTRDELAIEASGWRELLKTKVQELSELQIAHKQGSSADASPSEGGEPASETADSPSSTASHSKQVSELQDQRSHLTDRLNVVLDAWEAKGGEVEEYRQYTAAVGGLGIDVNDASSAWTAIYAWLVAEQGGKKWLWNLIKCLAILFAVYLLSGFLGMMAYRASGRIEGNSELMRDFLKGFVQKLTWVIGLIVAASALEINISPLLAAIGGAAFVVGLALQSTLSNFASGLIILGYRPFDVGDVVDAGGVSGVVDSMNLISTRIRTFDNKVMVVPNNKIATDTITNASASDQRRVDLVFGIGYDDDLERAETLLMEIVTGHDKVLPEPAPVIQVNELADSSINFICRPWVRSEDYWTVWWDLTRTVKLEFDRQGISIPYPQQDIHLYSIPASTDSNASSSGPNT